MTTQSQGLDDSIRLAVSLRSDCWLATGIKTFGRFSRETGHKREPAPPQMMTIEKFSFMDKFYLKKKGHMDPLR